MRRWYLLLVAVCTGWGTIPLVLRQMTLPPQGIAFGRVAVASVGLGGLLALRAGTRPSGGAPFPRPYSVMPLRCAANGLLLAVHWLTMFIAFDRVPAGTVILIIFLAPVGVAALAPRLLGERIGIRTVVAVVLGLGGVALIAGPALEDVDLLGLSMAATSMLLLVALNLASKSLVAVYGGRRLAFIETGGAALALLPVALFADWSGLSASWPWLLLLGAVHTATAVALYLAALRHLPVTQVSIISYLEPLAVVALAWLVLSEEPSLFTLAGGALVIGAGVLVVLDGRGGAAPPEPVFERADPQRARDHSEVLRAAG